MIFNDLQWIPITLYTYIHLNTSGYFFYNSIDDDSEHTTCSQVWSKNYTEILETVNIYYYNVHCYTRLIISLYTVRNIADNNSKMCCSFASASFLQKRTEDCAIKRFASLVQRNNALNMRKCAAQNYVIKIAYRFFSDFRHYFQCIVDLR